MAFPQDEMESKYLESRRDSQFKKNTNKPGK